MEDSSPDKLAATAGNFAAEDQAEHAKVGETAQDEEDDSPKNEKQQEFCFLSCSLIR